MKVTAIVAAGGRGVRLGATQPKQLLRIGGRSILERTVALFLDHPSISEVIVALPQELAADPSRYLPPHDATRLRVVAGGARRQDSVRNAFEAASPASEIVLIHDAARPFASADLISRTIAAAVESGAALAAVWARDTVKRAERATAVVLETIARDGVALAQTPQAFRRDVLRKALEIGEREEATDEATLAERAGFPVRIVEGEDTNIKVTTPDDLVMAEAIVSAQGTGAPAMRVGTGYDLHRLVEGRPLILGGVTIPFERGLLGHSDADAICHAVTDAILGAAAAGDIGRHFPDTDPEWRGASSVDLLKRAVEVIHRQGLRVGNVDVVVIAERPKIGPYVDAMRACVADALGVDVSQVSIKGKTNEGVGEIGRGEAIATHAIALLET